MVEEEAVQRLVGEGAAAPVYFAARVARDSGQGMGRGRDRSLGRTLLRVIPSGRTGGTSLVVVNRIEGRNDRWGRLPFRTWGSAFETS